MKTAPVNASESQRGLQENTLTRVRGAYLRLTNVGRKRKVLLFPWKVHFFFIGSALERCRTLEPAEIYTSVYKTSQLRALLNLSQSREHDYPGWKPSLSAS